MTCFGFIIKDKLVMLDVLEIDGKKLSPIKEAANAVSYSRDYVTRLAREGKIFATVVGRQWFVDLDSLKAYSQNMVLEQEVRKRQLSEERKQECQVRDSVIAQKKVHNKRARSLHTRAVAIALVVLSFGILSGWGVHQFILTKPIQLVDSHTSQRFTGSVAEATNMQNSVESVVSEVTVAPINNSVSQDIQGLGDVKQGVLLLPASGSTTSVNSLFSDEVVAVQKEDGSYVVGRVDKVGNLIGSEIPFVVVPIVSSDI
ncbi:MAG: hypothetical protein RLZZ230_81 [Candidatus Parcubacteria bacterium]|jgi:excisionase family DNA binding protein